MITINELVGTIMFPHKERVFQYRIALKTVKCTRTKVGYYKFMRNSKEALHECHAGESPRLYGAGDENGSVFQKCCLIVPPCIDWQNIDEH